MKKMIVAVMIFGIMVSAVNAGMKYECWMYKDGKPWKMTYLVADSKAQAESKAVAMFRDLGRNGDYIKCK